MSSSKGRRLYREYAKSIGLDCVEFISLVQDYYCLEFTYKDSNRVQHTKSIQPFDVINWMIRTNKVNI